MSLDYNSMIYFGGKGRGETLFCGVERYGFFLLKVHGWNYNTYTEALLPIILMYSSSNNNDFPNLVVQVWWVRSRGGRREDLEPPAPINGETDPRSRILTDEDAGCTFKVWMDGCVGGWDV